MRMRNEKWEGMKKGSRAAFLVARENDWMRVRTLSAMEVIPLCLGSWLCFCFWWQMSQRLFPL